MNGLIRYSPLAGFLSREFNDLFCCPPQPNLEASSSGQGGSVNWSPSVDIVEKNDEFVVSADLAGVNKDDIKIQVKDDCLTISGERKRVTEDEKTHRVERYHGSFSRCFCLPENVKANDIRAESRDGVLNVHVPKTSPEEEQAKSIDIKID